MDEDGLDLLDRDAGTLVTAAELSRNTGPPPVPSTSRHSPSKDQETPVSSTAATISRGGDVPVALGAVGDTELHLVVTSHLGEPPAPRVVGAGRVRKGEVTSPRVGDSVQPVGPSVTLHCSWCPLDSTEATRGAQPHCQQDVAAPVAHPHPWRYSSGTRDRRQVPRGGGTWVPGDLRANGVLQRPCPPPWSQEGPSLEVAPRARSAHTSSHTPRPDLTHTCGGTCGYGCVTWCLRGLWCSGEGGWRRRWSWSWMEKTRMDGAGDGRMG